MFHVEHGGSLERFIEECGKTVSCPLSGETVNNLLSYLGELSTWNKKINLTGLKNNRDIIIELLIDSLACGRVLDLEIEKSIIDIGSGAGIPGIPLKIAFPEIDMTLLEPRLKKATFLRHIVGTLDLKNIQIISRTVQDLFHDPSFNSLYDKVIAKAIKPESIFPAARSLLKPSGRAVLFRSQVLNSCDKKWGMTIENQIEYELPEGYGKRFLSILKPVENS